MDSIEVIDFHKILGNSILFKRGILYNIKKKAEPFPSEIQIQTVNSCNGSCQMCPNMCLPEKKQEFMTKDLFEKIAKEISNEKSGHVFIEFMLQNEPLMDEDIFKKIRFLKDIVGKNKFTMLVTNGSLFTAKKINELKNSGLDILIFSVDALKEETYNQIRGGLNFKLVQKNIENVIFSDYNNCLLVSFVKQNANISELKEFNKYWKKKGISTLTFDICNRTGDVNDFENLKLQNMHQTLLKKFMFNIWRQIEKCCIVPLVSFNILYNGDVILCCNDYRKKLVLGNINDSSIKEIWESKKYQTIRKLHFNGQYKKIPACNNCSIRERYII